MSGVDVKRIWKYFPGDPGPISIQNDLCRYGDSHYKGKSIVRPSYLCNGNPYTGKKASLF